MTYRTLISKTDDEMGVLGLMIEGVPMLSGYPMVATEGLLLAHDIIEHQNGLSAIGSIGDELEALGGVWFTRGRHFDMRRDNTGSMHSPESHISSDVLNMAGMFANGVPLRVQVKQTKSHDHDDSFQEIIEMAEGGYRDEYDGTPPTEYFDACLHLMRTGYRKAVKRFQGRDANSMFWNIAEACDAACKNVDYEGQRFTLHYDSNSAYCVERYEVEEY